MIFTEDIGAVRLVSLSGGEDGLSAADWERLAAALTDLEASSQRALVLIGGADFCRGADHAGAAGTPAALAPLAAAMRALHRTTRPSVAAVDGRAFGAGLHLALGCDLVLATPRASFAEDAVRRGLGLDPGGSWLLPRVVGTARARELALTGRVVPAAEAVALGLALRLVDPARLRDEAIALAAGLAAGAPLAQRFVKQGLDHGATADFEEMLAYEVQAQTICLSSADAAEARAAAGEGREPVFRGR